MLSPRKLRHVGGGIRPPAHSAPVLDHMMELVSDTVLIRDTRGPRDRHALARAAEASLGTRQTKVWRKSGAHEGGRARTHALNCQLQPTPELSVPPVAPFFLEPSQSGKTIVQTPSYLARTRDFE
jgi:hypothetical protein